MYELKVKLSPDKILEKEFKYDAKGYRPQEVDEYLDIIIEDYNEFIHLLKKLQKENDALREENSRLNSDVRRLEEDLKLKSENTGKFSSNNVDILRRLSNLEKIVYGKNE